MPVQQNQVPVEQDNVDVMVLVQPTHVNKVMVPARKKNVACKSRITVWCLRSRIWNLCTSMLCLCTRQWCLCSRMRRLCSRVGPAAVGVTCATELQGPHPRPDPDPGPDLGQNNVPVIPFLVLVTFLMISMVLASPMIHPPCQVLLGAVWRTPPLPLGVASKIEFLWQPEIYKDFPRTTRIC